MYKIYVDLVSRQSVLPFASMMGAIYFVTSCRENAEHRLEYLPAMDVVDDTTGEIVFQSPEIAPCEYRRCADFARLKRTGADPCASCPKKDCGLRDSEMPW